MDVCRRLWLTQHAATGVNLGLRVENPLRPVERRGSMEATRLAPAGRACSKFIWQNCRFQKNWAVRVLPRSGRPAFFALELQGARSQAGGRGDFIFDCARRLGPIESDLAAGRKYAVCMTPSGAGWTPRGARVRRWPRSRRDWASLVAGGMRRDGGRRRKRIIASAARLDARLAGLPARERRNSLANSKQSRVNSAQQA